MREKKPFDDVTLCIRHGSGVREQGTEQLLLKPEEECSEYGEELKSIKELLREKDLYTSVLPYKGFPARELTSGQANLLING